MILLSAGAGFWIDGGRTPRDCGVVLKLTSSLIRSVRKYLPLSVVMVGLFMAWYPPPQLSSRSAYGEPESVLPSWSRPFPWLRRHRLENVGRYCPDAIIATPSRQPLDPELHRMLPLDPICFQPGKLCGDAWQRDKVPRFLSISFFSSEAKEDRGIPLCPLPTAFFSEISGMTL